MAPDQESKPQAQLAESSSSGPPQRRGRRSGRGRRGKGRRPGPRPAPGETQPEYGEPRPVGESPGLPGAAALQEEPDRPPAPPPVPRQFQPASPANVQQAIEEVSQVIESLREALDDMEEVLETLELAERQKVADEQEIDALRRTLRQLQRSRDSGGSTPRGPSPESH